MKMISKEIYWEYPWMCLNANVLVSDHIHSFVDTPLDAYGGGAKFGEDSPSNFSFWFPLLDKKNEIKIVLFSISFLFIWKSPNNSLPDF